MTSNRVGYQEMVVMVKSGLLLIGLLGCASLVAGQSAFDGKWTAQVVRPAPKS